MKLLKKGAEANIYLERKSSSVIKDRIRKGYRLEALDRRLRESRTKKEAKLLKKASQLTPVPKILSLTGSTITMEYIDGKRLKDIIDRKNCSILMGSLGRIIAKLHENDIVHGDLTTSNFMMAGDEIYILDFGLGCISPSVEKKAVDLHLFEEALESTHPELYEAGMKRMLDSYSKTYTAAGAVIGRLTELRKRGRYIKR